MSDTVLLRTRFCLSQLLTAEKRLFQPQRIKCLLPLHTSSFARECDFRSVVHIGRLAGHNQGSVPRYENGRSEEASECKVVEENLDRPAGGGTPQLLLLPVFGCYQGPFSVPYALTSLFFFSFLFLCLFLFCFVATAFTSPESNA